MKAARWQMLEAEVHGVTDFLADEEGNFLFHQHRYRSHLHNVYEGLNCSAILIKPCLAQSLGQICRPCMRRHGARLGYGAWAEHV